MNVLTILLDIQGSCHILGEKFDINYGDNTLLLECNQTNFSIGYNTAVNDGWNTIKITHNEHNNDLTQLDQYSNIIDFSYVSLDYIALDGYEISHNMWKNSGGKAYNPFTNKQLHMYKLGEPFCIEINFYSPLEYWTFALAKSNNNYGKIGWK